MLLPMFSQDAYVLESVLMGYDEMVIMILLKYVLMIGLMQLPDKVFDRAST